MRCEDLAEQLTDLLEGTLDAAAEEAALAHLGSCQACEQVLSQTRQTIAVVQDHGRAQLDDETKERLFSRIIDGVEGSSSV